MPELPEVEVVRRQLSEHILNREIASVEIRHEKTTRQSPEIDKVLPGCSFESIDRIGKLLAFSIRCHPELDSGPNTLFLLAHLKMTGQFIFVDSDEKVGGGHSLTKSDFDLPHKHTRTIFHFTDGSALYFNDMRLFGYLKLATQAEKDAAWSKYGPEPGQPDYTWENFEGIFKNRTTSVKALLLNQSVIAGLGNIYVDEACFRSKVLPYRRANSLNQMEKKALFKHCEAVMMESIERGGTTFYSFISSDGKKGNFSDELEVFDRAGQPCYTCGEMIEKIKHAGRGTHFCPHCQR